MIYIYKALHRKLKTEQQETSPKKNGLTRVHRKNGKQFLLHCGTRLISLRLIDRAENVLGSLISTRCVALVKIWYLLCMISLCINTVNIAMCTTMHRMYIDYFLIYGRELEIFVLITFHFVSESTRYNLFNLQIIHGDNEVKLKH